MRSRSIEIPHTSVSWMGMCEGMHERNGTVRDGMCERWNVREEMECVRDGMRDGVVGHANLPER